jgi:hypothetical protein
VAKVRRVSALRPRVLELACDSGHNIVRGRSNNDIGRVTAGIKSLALPNEIIGVEQELLRDLEFLSELEGLQASGIERLYCDCLCQPLQ